MIQPVLPYALVGLAVGSLSNRPYSGALVGSLLGVARTARGADDPQYGFFPTLPFLMAARSDSPGADPIDRDTGKAKVKVPGRVTDAKSARLAAAVAMVNSGHLKELGGKANVAEIATLKYGDMLPWSGQETPDAILKATLQRGPKLGLSERAYLISVLAGFKTRQALYTQDKPKKTAKAASKAVKAVSKQSSVADTPSQPGEPTVTTEIVPWYRTPKGRVGVVALAGVGSIVLLLALTRK